MAKANIKLPNGTIVNIEGDPEEIHRILSLYSEGKPRETVQVKNESKKGKSKKSGPLPKKGSVGLSQVVNQIKSCDESENIENNILDQTSVVNRTLLPLYIVHEYFDNSIGLTTGEISKITGDLGVPVSTANVAHTFSDTSSRYVLGDKVRKKGVTVRYKISRKGLNYLKSVIQGSDNG
jgi:hypothetical protein